MTKEETLLWMIALDYASCEAWDFDESEFLAEWWSDVRDNWSVMR